MAGRRRPRRPARDGQSEFRARFPSLDDTGAGNEGQTQRETGLAAIRSCKLGCMSTFRIAGVIPARLHSTRLSRKVLRPIAGRPMLEWVWRAAQSSGLMDAVVVATDSEEV